MSKNKDTLWISNSSNGHIMPIAPVILPQWILGGIVVAGLLFSGKPAALPVDEADLLNQPDAYSESLKPAKPSQKSVIAPVTLKQPVPETVPTHWNLDWQGWNGLH